jgi:hypothetical protein
MSSANISKLIIGLIFFTIFLINSRNYLVYKSVVEKDKPVEYTVVKTYYKSGRGRSYYMDVTFQSKKYKLWITEKTANNIEEKIYPDVYYVKRDDSLITNWNITRSFRILIAAFIFVFVWMLPFNKIIGKANANKR